MTQSTNSRLRAGGLRLALGSAVLVLFLATSRVPATAVVQQAAVPAVEQQADMPDVQSLGPQVGTRVPDFTLADQRGTSRTLTSLMGPKGLMLVFIRSADW